MNTIPMSRTEEHFRRPSPPSRINLCVPGRARRLTMQKAVSSFLLSTLMLGVLGVHAQTMKSDHWSTPELLERAKHLRELAAKGDGSASETLEKYPHHYTMLAYRSTAEAANCIRTSPTSSSSSTATQLS